jgi:hypothetical protein
MPHWTNFALCILWEISSVVTSKNITEDEVTWVTATHVQVFLLTSVPRRALPFTMQYGTPILRQRAGRNNTNWKSKCIPLKFPELYSNKRKTSEIFSSQAKWYQNQARHYLKKLHCSQTTVYTISSQSLKTAILNSDMVTVLKLHK